MARALKAFINSFALHRNLVKVREITQNKKVLAMIKANGYGHGIVNVAKSLQEADAFGVACIEEAVELREAGIQNRIVLMEGFFDAEAELPEIFRLNLEPVVHHESHIGALASCENPLRIWLKINTGMNRLGFPVDLVHPIRAKIAENPALSIAGYLTHFAKADEVDNPFTQRQIEKFEATIQHLPEEKSLANSAAILAVKNSHGDWVRPGIMLYGVSPFPKRHGALEGLIPVMSLRSALIAIQSLAKGEIVGYGGDFVCPHAMRIGVVAVGYGDGYPRLAPTGTPILVNGKRTVLVGRVSMDMVAVDLNAQPEAKVGDIVELWGEKLPVETVAEAIGTTAYELLTGLSTRVPLEIIG